MSKIVDSYVYLNGMFQKCVKNQFEGIHSFGDMQEYYRALDSFVIVARECYLDGSLDLGTSMTLFYNDASIKEELANRLPSSEQESVKSK